MIVTSLLSWLAVQAQVCASAFITQNNTILHLGNISHNGLSCDSPRDENDIGEWFYPNCNEELIHIFLDQYLLHFQEFDMWYSWEVTLSLPQMQRECTRRIPDESNVQQTVYVGMYQTSTYESSSE